MVPLPTLVRNLGYFPEPFDKIYYLEMTMNLTGMNKL